MPLNKVISQIKSNKLAPFYYFYGDEKYLLGKAVAALTKYIASKGLSDFNLDKLSLTENSVDDICSSAYLLPTMSDKRLIIVRDAEKLRESGQKQLLKYILDPLDTSCIIFINNKDKVDGRLKFFAALKKKGELMNFKPLYENKLPGFIKLEVKNLNKMIDDDALQYLIRIVGNNLLELEGELTKIAIAIGDKKLISLDDVKEVCSEVRRNTVFELADCLGSKDITSSLRILGKMIEHGEYPTMILGAIIRHFNNLFEIRERVEKRETKEQIAKSTRIHPFFLSKYITQSKKLKKSDIKRVFDSLLLTDIALKSRKLPDKLILEKLFFDLCL